jgi:hypothetical protein
MCPPEDAPPATCKAHLQLPDALVQRPELPAALLLRRDQLCNLRLEHPLKFGHLLTHGIVRQRRLPATQVCIVKGGVMGGPALMWGQEVAVSMESANDRNTTTTVVPVLVISSYGSTRSYGTQA